MFGTLIRQERLRQKLSQEALCHGVCSTSYLSKIENDVVECNIEIYEKLFKRLKISYTANERSLAALDREYENVFFVLRSEGYFYFEDTGVPISPLCEEMVYSPRHIEASLLCALDSFFKTGEISPALLDLPVSALDENTELLRTLIRALYLSKKRHFSEAESVMRSIESAAEPWTTQAIGFYCFKTGHYDKAEENLRLAYSGFANGGYVHAMLDTAQLLAAIGSGSADTASMHRWEQITRRINSVVGNQKIEASLCYNLGAACLMFGDVDRGTEYLEKCRETVEHLLEPSPHILNMMYQKLAFAYALKRKFDDARDCLSRINEQELNGHLLSFMSVIRYILEHPNWQGEQVCCEMLERCYAEALEGESAIGFARFYVFYLLESYRAQRKYKNACALLEQVSFLRNRVYPH